MRRPLLAVVALITVACGSGATEFGHAGDDIGAVDVDRLPASVLDMDVVREADASGLRNLGDTYVRAASLFSLRSDDLVQATFQVTELTQSVDDAFREAVVARIGAIAPRPTLVDGRVIYITTGTKQVVALWFGDADFYVLNIRDDFTQPRRLIRRLMEVGG